MCGSIPIHSRIAMNPTTPTSAPVPLDIIEHVHVRLLVGTNLGPIPAHLADLLRSQSCPLGQGVKNVTIDGATVSAQWTGDFKKTSLSTFCSWPSYNPWGKPDLNVLFIRDDHTIDPDAIAEQIAKSPVKKWLILLPEGGNPLALAMPKIIRMFASYPKHITIYRVWDHIGYEYEIRNWLIEAVHGPPPTKGITLLNKSNPRGWQF